METLRLEVKGTGFCGNMLIREQLSKFVAENFETLYSGAVRRRENIPADYYACQRIQTNRTRLHRGCGLKIAAGHHIDDEGAPTEGQLRETIADIQALLDAAAENIPAAFTLTITKGH